MSLNDNAKLIGVYSDHPVQRWDGEATVPARERVAEEVPVALVYNGLPHVVMMASPADLEDFALGFSLSEGVLKTPRELDGVEIVPLSEGVEVHMSIDVERYRLIENQRRNLPGRSGCGVCGSETIDQAVRHPAPVGPGPRVSHDVVHRAFATLAENQRLNAATGAVHAAAWATPVGELMLVREDVGRHNALDKLIGAMISAGYQMEDGFALITSRASFEMVQKAATVGITLLVAISAPTGLAIRLAQETGLTLAGFARKGQHNVYTHSFRLT